MYSVKSCLLPVTREDIALLSTNHELGGYSPLILQDGGSLGEAGVGVGLVFQVRVKDELLHSHCELPGVPP